MLSSLANLASPWAYVLVGALALLEASAFVGLVVPGETALLVGGFVAYQGRADLWLMMAVAAIGAIVGDSIGYEVGRHLGPALRRSRLGRRVGEQRWARAEAYVERRGGRAVFLGRFVGVLRALVPTLAGVSRMPYRRFVAWNAAGGLVWAPTFVAAGYLAGGSYRRVERYAGQATLVLVVVVAMAAAVGTGARWAAQHRPAVVGWVARQSERPRVARLRLRYARQVDFVAARLRPGGAFGLSLTAGLAVLALFGWAFGVVVEDVVSGNDLAGLDRPVARFFVAHRSPWATQVMKALTWLGSGWVLVPVGVIAGVGAWVVGRRWRPAVVLAAAQTGAFLLSTGVKHLVGRARPPATDAIAVAGGFSFPAGHATQVVAALGALAFVAARPLRRWSTQVAVWGAASLAAMLVGISRLYLGVHWLSDVLGGFALGGLWLAVVLVSVTALQRHHPQPDRPGRDP